jgi:hypothetical protein
MPRATFKKAATALRGWFIFTYICAARMATRAQSDRFFLHAAAARA